MKKRLALGLILLLLITMVIVFSFSGCKTTTAAAVTTAAETTAAVTTAAVTTAAVTTAAETTTAKKTPVFGNMPVSLADVWNAAGVEAFKYAAKLKGVEVVVMDQEWTPEKAITNMQNMITKGVDSVGVFVYYADQAKDLIKMANDAKIPIGIENTLIGGKVPGDYVTNVAVSYSDIGYAAGKFIHDNWPGTEGNPTKVFWVRGAPGMGIVEDYKIGIDKAFAEFKDIKLIDTKDTDWGREKSINVTQAAIQSGEKFDVIFANNETMAGGVVQALKEASLFGKVKVISTGGSPDGLKMLESGEIQGTMATPVSLISLKLFKYLWMNYNGKPVPKEDKDIPIIPLTKDNIKDNIPWQASQALIDMIGGLDQ